MSKRLVLCLVDRSNEFQRRLRKDAEAVARQTGLTLETHFTGHDFAAQLTWLRESITATPAAAAFLVMAVRDRGLSRVARAAAEAGIGWVFLNRAEDDLDEIRRDHASLPLGCVCVDERETGRIQARQVAALAPAGGVVLYLKGHGRSLVVQDRTAGFEETIAGSLKITSVEVGWDAGVAQKTFRPWLAGVARMRSRLDIVACQNDALAKAAREVLEEVAADVKRPELARVPILGCDGILPSPAGHAVRLLDDHFSGRRTFPPFVALAPKAESEESLMAPFAPASGFHLSHF
jgi:ABC-type sugar transport system substrate-binding protein